MARLERQGWWGQVVGPHGSGKSTLLATLLPELRQRRPVASVTLHDRGQLPVDVWSLPEVALLVVDGYEQLCWWVRRRLQILCRRQRSGLLVTTHHDLWLPDLYRTNVTPELAQVLIEGLLTEEQRSLFQNHAVKRYLDRRHGNLRELLFDLYDRFETGELSHGTARKATGLA